MGTVAHKIATVSSNLEAATRAGDVTAMARLMISCKGDRIEMLNAGARIPNFRTSERVAELLKSAVPVGDTSAGSWSAPLGDWERASEAFLESLRPMSVFDRMLGDGMMRVPQLQTNVVIVTGGVTGYGVNSASVKPLSSLSLAADTVAPRKAIAAIVVSDDLARFASPAAVTLFNTELRKGVAAASDSVFLAGLADGVTPTASAGASSANVYTDLAALLAAISTGANSRLYFIVSAASAKKLVTKTTSSGDLAFPRMGINGGEILPGIPALVTDQLAAGTAMMVDATGLIGATSAIELRMSKQSTIQFDTAPDSPPSALTGVVSLWHRNLRALLAERWFGFEKMRSTAAATLSGVAY